MTDEQSKSLRKLNKEETRLTKTMAMIIGSLFDLLDADDALSPGNNDHWRLPSRILGFEQNFQRLPPHIFLLHGLPEFSNRSAYLCSPYETSEKIRSKVFHVRSHSGSSDIDYIRLKF